ncbi:MAG: hypothetical protein NZ700_08120 [Gemmataceae bacterium]|nr:hypothetical protein [Gemmataceae bacterium]MDW8264371.1 hypothetical protein [Gemmataceae bacterium]
MRNLLAFLAAAAITFAILGWYLDWYKVQSTPMPCGNTRISIDINGRKIREDVRRGVQQGEEKLSVKSEAEQQTGAPRP